MSERTETRTRAGDDGDLLVDLDAEIASESPESSDSDGDSSRLGGLRSRVRSPVEGLFSPRAFLAVLLLSVVGMLVAGAAIPLGGVAGLVGVGLAGFLAGVGDGTRRYLEVGLAGGVAAGVAAFLDHVVLTLLGVGAPLVVLGVGAGVLAAVAGHYLGRDLRDGLTREV